MNDVDKYHEEVKQSKLAMTQSYYNKQAPMQGNPAGVPVVPRDRDSGDQLVKTEDVEYKYVELKMPDGKNYLAILTPHEVGNGPGEKYEVVEAGQGARGVAGRQAEESHVNPLLLPGGKAAARAKKVLDKIAPEAGKKQAHDDVYAAGTGEIPDKWKPM